jgi:hypothetical protein
MERMSNVNGVRVQCRDGDVLRKMPILLQKLLFPIIRRDNCFLFSMDMEVRKYRHLLKQISKVYLQTPRNLKMGNMLKH